MRIVDRILKGNPNNRSRLHTGKGQRLPLVNWKEIPKSLWSRMTDQGTPSAPWMTPGAVTFLQESIESNWRVFEFGSGTSTVWYAKRASQVISVEDDPDWYTKVSDILEASEVENCELNLVDGDGDSIMNSILVYPDESFDLVVVDFKEAIPGDRARCVATAMNKVRRGGMLVLDDSDRPQYRSVDKLLTGWRAHCFPGVKPVPLAAVETSVFQRP